jgi:hypothetical protein
MENTDEIKRKSGRWTPEEENLLRTLAKGGVPLADIVKKLGRSKEALRTKASTLGVSLRS